MGDHHKSNKEIRKRKYTEQYNITAQNKKRKAKKREERLAKRAKERESR